MAQAPEKPLIAVVGATGTGKSDLAVEIALKFNGEIINGDAMQLYQGLPIITNKITLQEMKGVPHHLLGCIGLEEETWTVGKFVTKALDAMNDIRSRGKLPILVGGTHYYTQSLLFHDALLREPALASSNKARFSILEEPTSVILAKLEEVDPTMASRWHPNERRKIQRSLEIFLKTGKPASQVYDEQRTLRERSPGALSQGLTQNQVGLRFPTLVFWVHADKDALHQRLNERVHKMIAHGLLQEVDALAKFKDTFEASTGQVIDRSRGIWVSIGYKEFSDYQSAISSQSSHTSDLGMLKATGLEKTQAATRQYANRQLKWIRIKLLNALLEAGQAQNVYLLDGTTLAEWDSRVKMPALDITKQFLAGHELPAPSSISPVASDLLTPKRAYDLGRRPDLWQKRTCTTCGTFAVTENDWNLHVKSRAHRKAVGLAKKQKESGTKRDHRKPPEEDAVDIVGSCIDALPGIPAGARIEGSATP